MTRARRSRVWSAGALLATWIAASTEAARAQDVPLSYAEPVTVAEPRPLADTRVEEAVLAWRTGQLGLARALAQDALRADPDDPDTRLVEAAIRNDLDPTLALDPATRAASLEEFEAIGDQRVVGHVLGVVSAVVGLIGVFTASYLPAFLGPSDLDQARFAGGTVGILGLALGGVAIGLHLDAGARWHRWAEGLSATVGPGSLALRF